MLVGQGGRSCTWSPQWEDQRPLSEVPPPHVPDPPSWAPEPLPQPSQAGPRATPPNPLSQAPLSASHLLIMLVSTQLGVMTLWLWALGWGLWDTGVWTLGWVAVSSEGPEV